MAVSGNVSTVRLRSRFAPSSLDKPKAAKITTECALRRVQKSSFDAASFITLIFQGAQMNKPTSIRQIRLERQPAFCAGIHAPTSRDRGVNDPLFAPLFRSPISASRTEDARLDLTDLYAFPKPSEAKQVDPDHETSILLPS